MSGLMFPKPKDRAKASKARKASEPEAVLQQRVEGYLHLRQVRWIHVPGQLQNYLRNRAPVQIAKIASEAFKGLPDIMAIKPREGSETETDCLLLELKTEVGKLSQGQKHWHNGQNVVVAYGWEDAKTAIDRWLGDD